MTELMSALLIVAICLLVIFAASLSSDGVSLSWPGSETDPFKGRHIHVVASQADIDALPCDVPGCRFYAERAA